jgi:hypothetical protein
VVFCKNYLFHARRILFFRPKSYLPREMPLIAVLLSTNAAGPDAMSAAKSMSINVKSAETRTSNHGLILPFHCFAMNFFLPRCARIRRTFVPASSRRSFERMTSFPYSWSFPSTSIDFICHGGMK